MDGGSTRRPPVMKLVFGGGLWPLGWSVGFVERPLSETYARYRAWGLGAAFNELGQLPIVDALHQLLPFEMPYTRRLLVGTSGRWTAIFDNTVGLGERRSRTPVRRDVTSPQHRAPDHELLRGRLRPGEVDCGRPRSPSAVGQGSRSQAEGAGRR